MDIMAKILTHPGFFEVQKTIFYSLDVSSLRQCRLVNKEWQEMIDQRNILWPEILSSLQEKRLAWHHWCTCDMNPIVQGCCPKKCFGADNAVLSAIEFVLD